MPIPSPNASTFLKIQRASLTIGAAADFLIAAILLLAPGVIANILQLPLPGETLPAESLCLWLIGVLLFMASGIYLLAAYDPMAYAGNVLVAIAGRAAVGCILLVAAAGADDPRGLAVLGAVDLGFSVVHTLCWRSTRHLRSQLL